MFEIISLFASIFLQTTATSDFFNMNIQRSILVYRWKRRAWPSNGQIIVEMSTWNIINVCDAQMCLLKRTKKVVTEFFVVGSTQNMKQPFLHP